MKVKVSLSIKKIVLSWHCIFFGNNDNNNNNNNDNNEINFSFFFNFIFPVEQIKLERDAFSVENERLCFELQRMSETVQLQQQQQR